MVEEGTDPTESLPSSGRVINLPGEPPASPVRPTMPPAPMTQAMDMSSCCRQSPLVTSIRPTEPMLFSSSYAHISNSETFSRLLVTCHQDNRRRRPRPLPSNYQKRG
jgi:hypothetical protein